MSTLAWGIKASLLAYVRGMGDGSVVGDGASESPEGFVFPSAPDAAADGIRRFTGSVTLTAHGGMMRVVLADPWIDLETRELSVADPGDASRRLVFARIASFDPDAGGALRARTTTLTTDGADLFFGPYTEGTPLDDPVLTA